MFTTYGVRLVAELRTKLNKYTMRYTEEQYVESASIQARIIDELNTELKALKKVNETQAEQLILSGVINWVATEKDLPKQTGDILVYVDGLGVRNAIFNITDNSFSFNSIYKPTHWAELPKPPCL